jgi:stage II sporulation protein D
MMKRTLAVSAALYIALFLIPMLTVGQLGPIPENGPEAAPPPPADPDGRHGTPPPAAGPVAAAAPEPAPLPSPAPADELITVLVGGTPQVLPLRDFLAGAVAAEMPALYPEEALKAQAVAIRTLALYTKDKPYHENARICDDWECCLAYAPLAERAEGWGGQFEEFAQKITAAVDATDGAAIYYMDEPIEALFFAATDGHTRSAAEVWGGEAPYLQRVESAWDVEFPGGAKGHGVGMSQFGARQMALAGHTYEEILLWYYTDVVVR